MFIRTVGSAIEVILSLPERTQARPHWITAKKALYGAVDTHILQMTLPALKKPLKTLWPKSAGYSEVVIRICIPLRSDEAGFFGDP